ncbi:hypothetical protein BDV25DRAFT_135800 [Aspergillus avenaceus]|uniref:Uncharacterized protein n=1 Tax=Aspergillus avenaceus TaxID=36643 RepID=A0A5N6U7K4_ASPAV|nr:hypothetical protein BDV25DRAFT_135800 [Aspergillus avenaceus]
MSTLNMVKFYFYRKQLPRMRHILHDFIKVAYQTARDRKLYPKAILVSFQIKPTLKGDRSLPQLKGTMEYWHITFNYKDQGQLNSGTHTACHGYIPSEHEYELIKSTHGVDKCDTALTRNGKHVWPSGEELVMVCEVAYCHLAN